MNCKRAISAIFVLLVGSVLFTSPAFGDEVTLSINFMSPSPLPIASSYGTVHLVLTSDGKIDVVVTAASGYYIGRELGFNVADNSFLAGLSIASTGSSNPDWFSWSGPRQLDGFGYFDAGLQVDPANASHYSSVAFTVSRTGVDGAGNPLVFGSVHDLLALSTGAAQPAYFALRVGATGSTDTNFAWVGAVPEPASPLLLISGLLGLGLVGRLRLLG